MIHTPMTAPMFEDHENVQRIRAAHAIGPDFLEEVSVSLAPPAGRGWGEGPFFEFGQERFENPIEVIDDFVVPEADHAITKGA
jgi:hypothetical protein